MNKSTRLRDKKLILLILLIVGSGIFFISSVRSTERNNSLRYQEISSDKFFESSENYELLWNSSWNKNEIDISEEVAVGSSGIYVVGTIQDNMAMISDIDVTKVAFNGTLLWNLTLSGSGMMDAGYGVVVDSSDNIYLCGSTELVPHTGLWVLKFDSEGNHVWNTTWNDFGSADGRGMLLDSSENVWVCGSTETSGGGRDFLLIKFDSSNGTKLWNTTWGGPKDEIGSGLVMDLSGNLYVCGWKRIGATDDLAVVKFDVNGDYVWNVTWGGPNWDAGEKIAIDSSGNLYVIGYTQSYGAGGTDLALVKFYPNRTKAWNITWGGSLNDKGYDVKIDSSGDLYTCGINGSWSGINSSALVVKFNSSGDQIWNTTWGGPQPDSGKGIAIDATGAIYVCGSYSSGGSSDFSLIKYLESPKPPILDTITPNPNIKGTIHLNWTDVYRATTYYVYRANSPITTVSGLNPIAKANISTYTDNIMVDGIYYYAIIAGNIVGNSSASNCENITIAILNPPVLNPIFPNPSPDGSIQLNWSDIAGASFYYVFQDTANITDVSGLVAIANVTESNYTDTLTFSAEYFYVIVAGNFFGNSSISNCENVTVAILSPPVLNPINPNPSTDWSIQLNWSDVAGALFYYVFRDTAHITDVIGLVAIANVTESNYTDILTIYAEYFYVIVAGKALGNSSISNCENVTVAIPNPPILNPITPNPSTDGSIQLNWSDVAEASFYYVFRNTANITDVIGLVAIANVTKSNYIDILTVDAEYFYVIVTGNTLGNSSISNCENVTVAILSPPVLDPITPNPSTNGTIRLKWSNINEASFYYVFRDTVYITDVSGLVAMANVTESNYTDILTVNAEYFYVIIAGNPLGNSSISNCENVTVTLPIEDGDKGGNPGLLLLVLLIFPLIGLGIIVYTYYKRREILP